MIKTLMIQDWNDYRFFLSVAEHGTLKAASDALKVNLSTALRRINALEEKIGARLFERTSQGFSLTEAGHHMLEETRRMDDISNNIIRRLSGQDVKLQGKIKLTTSDSLYRGWLCHHLAHFKKEHPDIFLDIHASAGHRDLAKREADIAISVGNSRPDYFVGRELMPITYGYYIHKLRPEAELAPVSLEALKKMRVMSVDSQFDSQPFMLWQTSHIGTDAITDIADQFTTLQSMIKLQMGIGILPNYLADEDLVLLHALPKETEKQVWMLTHPDLRDNARIKLFMEWMKVTAAGKVMRKRA